MCVSREQARLDGAETTGEVALLEPALELLKPPTACTQLNADGGNDRVRQLERMPAPEAVWAGQTRDRGPALQQVQPPAERLPTRVDGGARPVAQSIYPGTEITFGGDHDLGGR